MTSTGPVTTEHRDDEHHEVHYWPNTGRVLVIHTDPTGAYLHDLRIVNTGCESAHLADTTARYAELLADDTPQAGLTAHHRDGTVTQIWATPATANTTASTAPGPETPQH